MGEDPQPQAARDCCAVDGLGQLLDGWQASGDPAQLEAVVAAVRHVVEAVAGRTLAQCHVADRSAVDDVVSLVLDHLRRLPRGGAHPVTAFRGADADVGRGLAYIRLLARNRARDVVRSRHRHERHARVFSLLDEDGRRAVSGGGAAGEAAAALHDRLLEATGRLEPPLRQVVELLLEGKSQVVIAHMLDVCEGTVSRMRKRAIDRLRELLND
jgi:RNA polymerase sigma factor (sigma-70 family)